MRRNFNKEPLILRPLPFSRPVPFSSISSRQAEGTCTPLGSVPNKSLDAVAEGHRCRTTPSLPAVPAVNVARRTTKYLSQQGAAASSHCLDRDSFLLPGGISSTKSMSMVIYCDNVMFSLIKKLKRKLVFLFLIIALKHVKAFWLGF